MVDQINIQLKTPDANSRAKVQSIILLIAFLLVIYFCEVCHAGLFTTTPDYVVRYRITIKVDTPEGTAIGTAVRQGSTYHEESIFPGQGGVFYSDPIGQAAVIDLGKRGVVFALLGHQRETEMVLNLLQHSQSPEKISIPISQVKFVQFQNLNDPQSAREICDVGTCAEERRHSAPNAKISSFGEAFGPGVSVTSVTIEQTTADITDDIAHWLPWLPTKLNARGTLTGTPGNMRKDPTGLYLQGDELFKGRALK